jgi:hypothetical protein
MYQVYYMDGLKLKTYCLSLMDRETAIFMRNEFNRKYHRKPYPNGEGYYPFGRAWIEWAKVPNTFQ